jgi:hypothetical protein
MVRRLVHHFELPSLKGDSYHLRDKKFFDDRPKSIAQAPLG